MEFKFPVNDVFKSPVVEIGHTLIPPGFTGDRRSFWDVVGKVSEVVNAMGEASAAAQGLTKPITTAERLRNSEHKIYLLIDQNAGNGRGAVTGMLKIGQKGLYVFDRNGQHYQVSPPCVLDFYIHESRQRTGLGKRLFEHMLQNENIEPVKMAIDRPSDKFLGFLNKHYSLNDPVKQMNNYVVFDGFFPNTPEKNGTVEEISQSITPGKKQSANGLQTTSYTSPLGRYGAPRPPCSMGQIIHNQSSTIPKNPEPTGVTSVKSAPETNYATQSAISPQDPRTVTQSAPNVSYQNQEWQQQNAVNNKYYQQQSNNVWQYQNNQQNDQLQQNAYQGQFPNAYQSGEGTTQDQGQATYQNSQQVAGMQNAMLNQAQQQFVQSTQSPGQYTQNNTQAINQQMQPSIQPQQQITQGNNGVQYAQNQSYPNAYEAQNIAYQQNQQAVDANYVQTGPQTMMQQNYYQPQSAQAVMSQQPQYAYTTPQTPVQNGQVYEVGQQPNVTQSANVAQNYQNTAAAYNMANQTSQPQISNQTQLQPNLTQSMPNTNYTQPQQVTYNASQMSQPQLQPNLTQSMPNANYTQSSQPQQMNQMSQQQVAKQKQLQPNLTQSMPNTNYTQPPQPQQMNQMSQQQVVNQKQLQPNLTQSMPNTNYNQSQQVAYNTTNQMAQPQIANQNQSQPSLTQSIPNTNVSNSQAAYNQVAQPNMMPQSVNHMQTDVDASQTGVKKTMSQANTVQNQAAINQSQNMKETLSKQRIEPSQYIQPQSNAVNQNTTGVLQHMEGNLVTKPSVMQTAQAHNAKGDMASTEDDELKYGYPPQVHKNGTQVMEEQVNSSPKLERPRSLSIQLSEEQTEDKKNDDVESEVPIKESDIEEEVIEKLHVSQNGTEHKNGTATPPAEKTPLKRTPSHLTEQGFFDLKFYHNKLW